MRIRLIFIFSILYLGLKSQGIEPTSIQASQYKKGILQAITPYYDEFTGDTLYQYAHLDSSIIGGATISGVYPRIPYFRTASSLGHSDSLRWDTLNGALILRDIPIGSNADRQLYVGSGAGSGAINATDSNFFGTDAGSGATDADASNFFGYSAGYNATNANGSNFFGNGAGYGATNAVRCNLFGGGSGYGATDISDSNFFGSAAGSLATDATGSNFFGANAGNGADNASYSNLFGYGVGQTFTGNNIGSNNIIIGTNISLPNAAANAINLGGILFGTGTQSSLSGDPKITATAGGKIGIMTVTPTQELHVTGNTRITGSIYDSNNEAGTSGQVLSSTVTGTDWINASGGIDSTVINGAYGIDVTESPVNTYTIKADTAELATPYDLTLKQDVLVSGTNIKTVNSNSLLGSGNVSVGTVTSVGITPGTSGTDIGVTGSPVTGSGSITLNIPTASATNRGALSSTDWSTFNSKIGGSGTNPQIPYFSGSGTLTSNAALSYQGTYLYTGFTEGIHLAGSNASYASGIKFRNDGQTHCTFGLKGQQFVFSNTASNHLTLWPSPTDRLLINMATGVINVPQLAGSGERLVSVNSSGDLIIPTTGVSPRIAYWSGAGGLTSTANLRSETNYLYTGYSEGIHINGSSASYASGIKFRNNAYTHCTFGLKGQDFVFSNTASSDVTLWASPSDKFTINMNSGQLTSSSLTGSGTGMVTVDGSGVFGRQAIPTGTVSGTGTNGYMSYWNGTTSQAASTISYGTSFGDTGIGFGLAPASVLGNIDFASGKYMNFRYGSYINTQSTGGGSYSAGSSRQILAKSDANNSMIWRSLGTVNGSHLMDGNITVGTIGGSGTTNYVPKFTSSINLGNSLLYDDNTNMGINTTAPTQKLDINGTLRVRSITGTATSIVGRTSDGTISAVGYGNGLGFSSGVLYVLDQNYAHAAQDFSNLSISTSPTALPLAVDSQGGTGISTNTATDEISVAATISAEVQFSVECKCNTAGKKVTMYLWHSPSNAIYLESRQYFNNTNEYANWNMFRRVTLAAGGYSLKAITDSGTADLQDCKVRFQIVKI